MTLKRVYGPYTFINLLRSKEDMVCSHNVMAHLVLNKRHDAEQLGLHNRSLRFPGFTPKLGGHVEENSRGTQVPRSAYVGYVFQGHHIWTFGVRPRML